MFLLSVFIFPFGRHERQPGDRLGHKVAQLLMHPSETRKRLTDGVFISDKVSNPVGLLELALPRVIALNHWSVVFTRLKLPVKFDRW